METSITQAKLVDEWAKILITRWQRQLRKRGIGKSYELTNSFTHQISLQANGEVRRIDLEFLQRGRFVDMGVGKGTPIALVKENARPLNRIRGVKTRRSKKWYSPTLGAETKKLAELLAEHYGIEGINRIEELSERIQIDL